MRKTPWVCYDQYKRAAPLVEYFEVNCFAVKVATTRRPMIDEEASLTITQPDKHPGR
jgi:hypothetical protein